MDRLGNRQQLIKQENRDSHRTIRSQYRERNEHNEHGDQLDHSHGMPPRDPRSLRDKLEQNYNSLVNFYEKELTQKDRDLLEAEDRIRYLEAELSGCRIKLRNYVSDYQISDAKIQEDLRVIRDNISNWVETFPDIVNFQELFEKRISAEVLQNLMPGWAHSFPNGVDNVQMEIMTSRVFELIWNSLFRDSIVGEKTHQKLISHLQEGMSYLEPRKDFESVSAWKSNTVRAYMAHPKYREIAEKHCYNLMVSVCELLSMFHSLDRSNWDHKMERFMMQIANPAAELAARMASSPSEYRWKQCFPAHKWFPGNIIRKLHLEWVTIIDAETHHKIRLSELERLNYSDVIGVFLALIFPGLSRCGGEHKKVLIEKPVILVSIRIRSGQDLFVSLK